MSFSGVSYPAIVTAAVLAWLVGALWYGVLAKSWVAAQGLTMEEFKAKQAAIKGSPGAYMLYVIAFVAELVMAWALAGVLGHLGPGQVTLHNGVISALFLWFGFVVTTLAVNYAFGGRSLKLYLIDIGHWLLVLVIIGVVIGGFGVAP